MSFLTCSRPDPSSKMGSSAVAVSSSVCIFPLATPSYLRNREQAAPTPVTSEGRDLPGGASSVTPSAASPYPVSRWRGLRQISIIYFGRRCPPPPPRLLPVFFSRRAAQRLSSTRPILRLSGQNQTASGHRTPKPVAHPLSPFSPLLCLS